MVTKSLRLLLTFFAVFTFSPSFSQQFIGLNTTEYAAIQHMPTNPAWVNNSENGMEIMFFSAGVLAGTNAFNFDKDFIFNGFNGKAVEGQDYYRDRLPNDKHMWANAEILGPAISFKYKKEHHFGVFTRARQIYRGGNIKSTQLRVIGQETPELFYGQPIVFEKAGFSTHTFAEVGFTYGRILFDNHYHIVKGGVSLKYLAGFVAGSIYTESLEYTPKDSDTIGSITGDLSAMYTYNIGPYIDNNAQNDLTSWFQRAGTWGMGLDMGMQYEYHPNGTPNEPTPYIFSIAASLTDIGSVGYVADTGSGRYDLAIYNVDTAAIKMRDYEGINYYMLRMESDTLLSGGEKVQKFRMGLPAAFRLNIDYNASKEFNLAFNMLLNLRGNGRDIYRPGYVNYINFTPSYGSRKFRAGIPFTVMGYQTLAIGVNFRFGPFYLGSTSALSMFMGNRMRNADVYMGLSIKFRENEYHYY